MMWPSATLSKSDPSTVPPPPEEVTIILHSAILSKYQTSTLWIPQAVTKKPRKPVSAFSFPPNSAAWAAARALCDAVVEPKRTREVYIFS